jgi:hypothetical protein
MIDWRKRLAFEDTGEQLWFRHFSGDYAYCDDMCGTVHVFDRLGNPIDPRNIGRRLTNTVTEQDKARLRVLQKRRDRRREQEEHAAMEQTIPGWGVFG